MVEGKERDGGRRGVGGAEGYYSYYLVGQVWRITDNFFAPSSFPFWRDTNNFAFLIELHLPFKIKSDSASTPLS